MKKKFLKICASILLVIICLFVLARFSLPRDFLYPLKTGMFERIEWWFAFSDSAKAQWEVSILAVRLGEIEKLQEQSRLNDSVIADVRHSVNINMGQFQEITTRMEQGDLIRVTAVRSFLESTLEAHIALLEATQLQSSITYLNFVEYLHEQYEFVSEKRRSSEERLSNTEGDNTSEGATKNLNITERKIALVDKQITDLRDKNTKDTTLAEEKLKVAIAHVAEGKAKLELPAYRDASALFRRALREAESASTLLDAG